MPVKGTNQRAFGLAAVVVILVAALHGQGPLAEPELLSGEWETTTASGGIHGVWLEINTSRRKKNQTTTQGISVSIYHRQHGQDTGALSSEKGGSFNGANLRLQSQGMDLTFDARTHRWTGSWLLDGETRKVVLERPTCQSHPLCGTWEGRDPVGPVRFHIAQSSDGFVTAWMDRAAAPTNQRHGERLRIVSSEPPNLVIETISAGCCTNRFTGRLTEDRMSLSGKWSSLNLKVDAQQVFRRIP